MTSHGQVLVEFALVAPILLAGLLGAADLGYAGFQLLRMQQAAGTLAAVPTAEAAELARLGMACTATFTETAGVRLAALTCTNPLPLTGLLAGELHVEATAPLP